MKDATNKAEYVAKTGSYRTPKVMILYAHLFKPWAGKNDDGKPGTPKFDLTVCVPKNADISLLEEAADEVAKARWPKGGAWEDTKRPFRSLNEKTKGARAVREALEEAGIADDFQCFFSMRSTDKPQVVGPSTRPIEPANEADEVYAGRWCKATFAPFAYANSGNEGVSFGLRNVQLLEHDDPIKLGRVLARAEDEFEAAAIEDVGGRRGDARREEPTEDERPARRREEVAEAAEARPARRRSWE